MTTKTEEYILNGIDEIIKTAKNPKEVWKNVEQRFGEAGLTYLDDMGYPYPDGGLSVETE